MKTKILFYAPHLSTGGMPQFLLKRIETLKDNYEIFVVENQCVSDKYVVQRNKIINLVGEKNFFTTIGKNLIKVIKDNKIDIVHLEHEAEGFDYDLMKLLYADNRKYKIVETCHNVGFIPQHKVFYPDAFAFCSPFHLETFEHIKAKKQLIMYPIEKHNVYSVTKKAKALQLGFREKKVNVLSVGLWCENKNQSKVLEVAKNYPDYDFHIVGNQAENFESYWKPLMENIPSNVKVWGEREDISDFMLASDIFFFPSKNECNPIVLREAIGYGLTIYANNLSQYCGMFDGFIQPIHFELKKKLSPNHPDTSIQFKKDHLDFYNSLIEEKPKKQPKNRNFTINNHFVDGAFLEINGNSKDKFKVEFFDGENLFYENTINCNSWVKLNRKYYTNYKIKVSQIKKLKVYDFENVIETKVILDEQLSLKGKKVMISFESSSLGDTLAWMPYCDEFQKKHDCVLFVSTFKNFLFEGQYPNINFIKPAEVVTNLYAKYDLGWFYDTNKEPVLPNTIPLQQTATNILGLDFSEIKPKLNFEPKKGNKDSVPAKYVCIAPDSTAGCKEWDAVNWEILVDMLVDEGYQVVNVSLNSRYKLKNVYCPENLSLESTMQIIHFAKFFIGLSSGLSWLAWSLNKHVYMIANFTKADHEFQKNCTRFTNENVCNGCWNNKNFKFDKGNWNWCPIWDGYDKQFECQKGINPFWVLEEIKDNINYKRLHN
jgi:autotransporter strand-loop-strand O-heptosyltransferase